MSDNVIINLCFPYWENYKEKINLKKKNQTKLFFISI
jgi:hypothetical protein